jgi:sortase A
MAESAIRRYRSKSSGEMLMKNNRIGILLVLMLFVGVCGLLYPSVSQYWNSKTQSRAVENYQDILASIRPEDYSAYFEEAHQYNQDLSALSSPLTDFVRLQNYKKTLDVSGNGVMGFITIPKIGVELPIYHSISSEVLNVACGHLEGTSLPIGGENTHCTLAGHRGLISAVMFDNIVYLAIGDDVYIKNYFGQLHYKVSEIKIVTPNDCANSFLIKEGKDLLTMFTCHPYGSNAQRYLVICERVE